MDFDLNSHLETLPDRYVNRLPECRCVWRKYFGYLT